MSATLEAPAILVLEPNQNLTIPYQFLTSTYQLTRLHDPLTLANELSRKQYQLVMLSCSFSSRKLLQLLETINQAHRDTLLPIVLVIDLHQPYSLVPGLNWANKVGLLSSQSDAAATQLVVRQLIE